MNGNMKECSWMIGVSLWIALMLSLNQNLSIRLLAENEKDISEGVEKCDVKIEDLQACVVRILKCCALCQKI